MNIKKIILPNLPYVLFIWVFDKVGQAFRLAGGADLSAKVLNLGNGFSAAFQSLGLSLHLVDLCIGVAGAVIIRLVVYFKGFVIFPFLSLGHVLWERKAGCQHSA